MPGTRSRSAAITRALTDAGASPRISMPRTAVMSSIASTRCSPSIERRTDRFLDVARSNGLPPFLAHDPGVDSGLMIAQYTAAGLVSELKRLAVPASVDSIPSSAMQEDHVSMGWHAARKLRRSIDALTRVLGIELLTAARAQDLRAPLEPSPITRSVKDLLRGRGIPGPGPDTYLSPDLEAAADAVRDGAVAAQLGARP